MQHISISSLKKATGEVPLSASFDAQLERKAERETKTDKPFYELMLAD